MCGSLSLKQRLSPFRSKRQWAPNVNKTNCFQKSWGCTPPALTHYQTRNCSASPTHGGKILIHFRQLKNTRLRLWNKLKCNLYNTTAQKKKSPHQARCRSVWECPRWTRRRSCAVARGRAACSPSGGTTEPLLWSLGVWGPAGVASGPTRPGWRASLPPLAEATRPTTFQCKTVHDKSFPTCSDLVCISAPTASLIQCRYFAHSGPLPTKQF